MIHGWETEGVATMKSARVLTLAERLRFIEQRVGDTGHRSESIVGKLVSFEQQWIGSVQRDSIGTRLDRLELVVSPQATDYVERLEQLKIKSDLLLSSVCNLEEALFGSIQDGPLPERVGNLEDVV